MPSLLYPGISADKARLAEEDIFCREAQWRWCWPVTGPLPPWPAVIPFVTALLRPW